MAGSSEASGLGGSASVLAAWAGLPHCAASLGAEPLKDLAAVLKANRPALLARLKALGITKLSERQALANALGRSEREGIARGKIVAVVRHGEAEHNISSAALQQRDTALTARGRMQAQGCRPMMEALAPQIIVTSPLLRTLQTTHALMPDPPPIKVVVHPDAREKIFDRRRGACNLPVDPSCVAALPAAAEFAAYDWQPTLEALASAGGSVAQWEAELSAADASGLRDRTARLSTWLEGLEEQTIALVSHGALLHELTVEACDEMMKNCEVRLFRLEAQRWTLLRPGTAELSRLGDADQRGVQTHERM